MIDKEYQKYVDEQSLEELKKIALRINKLHFPDEFDAVVKRIEDLEGDNFDKEFYSSPKMKDALHLEITDNENSENRIKKSQRILSAFLVIFSLILSINVYNLLINNNLLAVIPVAIYIFMIVLNINRSKIFGKVCKIWAIVVMLVTLTITFKDTLGLADPFFLDLLNSFVGSNQIVEPSLILLAAGILIFIYANHINFDEESKTDY